MCGKNARSSNNLTMLKKELYIIQIQDRVYSYKYLQFRHVGGRLKRSDSYGETNRPLIWKSRGWAPNALQETAVNKTQLNNSKLY